MAKAKDRATSRARELARRRAETHETGFKSRKLKVPEGTEMFDPGKAGLKRLDIIPYRVGKGNPHADKGEVYWERTYFMHYDVGPDNTSVVCPAKTAGKRCPICEHGAKLRKDPDVEKETWKALTPKERQLWNVVDLDDKEKGIQLYDVSFHLFGKYIDEAILGDEGDEMGYADFADLKAGKTLRVKYSQETMGGGSKFFDVARLDFKDRPKPYKKDILDESLCLDDLLIIMDYDELSKLYYQEPDVDEDDEEEEEEEDAADDGDDDEDEQEDDDSDDEDEEEEEEPKPKKKTAKKKPAKKAKEEEEDEDDSDDDDDDDDDDEEEDSDDEEEEEEEEEAKPAKKKGGKKAPAKKAPAKAADDDDDDDDDDWDDWDDEEDEPSPKKKKGKGK